MGRRLTDAREKQEMDECHAILRPSQQHLSRHNDGRVTMNGWVLTHFRMKIYRLQLESSPDLLEQEASA